MVIIIQ
jgi:putative transposase